RQTAHRGVRVQVEADRSIHLEVFITVDSEAKLAEVASAVQANVVEATERMLGLEVGEVNVFVSSIAFANSETLRGEAAPRQGAGAQGPVPAGSLRRRPGGGPASPCRRGGGPPCRPGLCPPARPRRPP